MSVVVFSLWFLPATAGILSQVRKGLPAHARPRRTIFCATLYEAHRLVHLALVVVIGVAVNTLLRYFQPGSYHTATSALALYGALFIFGSAAWIGPLRSDYTRQLIQSRLQAFRIVVFYAPLLFWLWLALIVAFIMDRF